MIASPQTSPLSHVRGWPQLHSQTCPPACPGAAPTLGSILEDVYRASRESESTGPLDEVPFSWACPCGRQPAQGVGPGPPVKSSKDSSAHWAGKRSERTPSKMENKSGVAYFPSVLRILRLLGNACVWLNATCTSVLVCAGCCREGPGVALLQGKWPFPPLSRGWGRAQPQWRGGGGSRLRDCLHLAAAPGF